MHIFKVLFNKRPLTVTLFILSTFALITYSNTFKGPFVFDDHLNILNNPHVRMTDLSLDYLSKLPEFHSEQRPLPNLTFALNYYFHEYDVTGYHVVNLLVHIITGFLVFLIFRQTLSLMGYKNDLLAAAAALFWLVNPVHTQSVTYIVQRMTSMATMFYLLSLFAYIKSRIEWRNVQRCSRKAGMLLILSVLSFLAALLSKQIAATLPLFVLLYEWFFIQDLDPRWIRRNAAWLSLGAVIIAMLGLAYFYMAAIDQIFYLLEKQEFTLDERLLTEPRVVVFYLSLLFLPLPSRLNLDHDIAVSTSLLEPASTVLSIALILGLLCIAVFAARKNYKLFSFSILWFFGNLVIESSIIPLALAYEHRTYLPSVFPLVAVVYYLFWAGRNHLKPVAAVFACLILLFSGLTLARNHTWADNIRFHKDCLAKSPEKPRVVINMGVAYLREGEYEKAINHFKRAIELDPDNAGAYGNLGDAYFETKEPGLAIRNLEKAIKLQPRLQFYSSLGDVYRFLNQNEKAIVQYRKALKQFPDNIPCRINLGAAYAQTQRYDKALAQFSKVLELYPEHYQAYNNMGFVYEKKGNPEKALASFKKALKIEPGSASTHLNLGSFYLKEGRFRNAEEHLLKGFRLAPESYEILKEAGDLYFEQNDYARAQKYYGKARDLHAEKAYPAVRLGIIDLRQKNYAEARGHFEKALKKGGTRHLIYYYLGLCDFAENDLEEGISHLDKALAAKPGFFKAKVKLADAHKAKGEKDKALSIYNEVLTANETDLHSLRQAGQIHMDKEEYEKALQKFEKAYQVDKKNQSVIQNLAFLYARFEQYGKAAEKFEALKAFMDKNPLLHYNLACMYSEAGKKKKALDNLELALEYGYDKKSKLMSDENLEFIRKTREFRELVARL